MDYDCPILVQRKEIKTITKTTTTITANQAVMLMYKHMLFNTAVYTRSRFWIYKYIWSVTHTCINSLAYIRFHSLFLSRLLARSLAHPDYITLQNDDVSDHTHIEHTPRTENNNSSSSGNSGSGNGSGNGSTTRMNRVTDTHNENDDEEKCTSHSMETLTRLSFPFRSSSSIFSFVTNIWRSRRVWKGVPSLLFVYWHTCSFF